MTYDFDVTGDGPAVLLLHSTVCDRRMWDPQVAALAAAGRRVVRLDLVGHGGTPVPAGRFDEAGGVAELLDGLGVGETALVGSSGGGRLALEFAARWPGRVTALALLCTALRGHGAGPELEAFDEREEALLEAGDVAGAVDLNVDLWVGPEADDATRERVRVMQRHAFDVQLAAEDVAYEPVRTDPDLSRISAPTLLVTGAHDLPDFREIAVHLAGVLPKAQHVELAWAGHLPSLERPEEINGLLLEFLAG
ncbi:alpha/beta fold hydrolase [Actinoplanes xinjiangensis]|uniref:Pimeloyl-ACP methyl ester carboxylesterase n=1 Tax=Actinoplanes xinjiangensis TaxID=512350 RepID=A0A316EGC1_9ACTN|nr:alpha/beta fold hydrolase [Actinoplanes xinjiangensis]PWK30655.1 pimeloyl-ACP methyl ester carboxylesterase [Actinoplanes xinjiangensis]GIF44342.1 alpha/beta hydrolase [Actinoplanes xinjiangensis]